MTSSKKGFKLKYILIPIAGLIGAAATVLVCKIIHKNNF